MKMTRKEIICITKGFQLKKPSICSVIKLDNLIAPKKPKNKATRLESSITRPFAKPFKNPKPSRRPIIKSTKFTLLNYFIFRNVGI